MKLLKMFLVTSLFLSVPVMPSQVISVTRQNQNVNATMRRSQPGYQPRTIWERMRDPKGWWQGRLVRSNPQAESQRRSSASGVHTFADGAITNPIFFIPPTYGSGGKLARNIEAGDFNGDGKADLLVSNECVSDADCSQGTVAVLLGNGDGTFQPALISKTGSVVASVTIGDFNRDGKLDVAVNNQCPDIGCTSGSVNILLGNGDGTFR